MGSLFSKKPKAVSRVTQQDEAILQLKSQRDKLKQYQRKIEVNLERERQLAKTLLRDGKKEKAKSLLKKKRFQEHLMEQTAAQQDNIERLIHDVEFAQVEVQVLEGLKSGNEALSRMHQVLSLDEVERIMDETKEAVEYQKEIDSLVSGGLEAEDLDDIEKELDELLEDEAREVGDRMPEVPKGELQREKEKERQREKKRAEPLLA